MFLGDDLLPLLVLALGAAMVFGNVLAIVRPPAKLKEGELAKAPVGRSVAMASLGLVAAVWAAASLLGLDRAVLMGGSTRRLWARMLEPWGWAGDVSHAHASARLTS